MTNAFLNFPIQYEPIHRGWPTVGVSLTGKLCSSLYSYLATQVSTPTGISPCSLNACVAIRTKSLNISGLRFPCLSVAIVYPHMRYCLTTASTRTRLIAAPVKQAVRILGLYSLYHVFMHCFCLFPICASFLL